MSEASRQNYSELMKTALIELKEARAELEALKSARSEPIAIIGMGCRFPGGADGLEAFWRLLSEGVDAIGEVPADRWESTAYYDPDPAAPGKMSTRFGGFLDSIDQFDCEFFGISPREAKSLDPQQRLLLEVSWEALEDAGQAPDGLYGSATGVFVGLSTFDYALHQVGGVVEGSDLEQIDGYVATGATMSPAAGRLSYVLGLKGPSMVVDTACSSSLVATHLGAASLRNRECNLALVGGANLILRPEWYVNFTKAGMLAPDGRCKTFDASANGYTRGEGCGVLVLKRLSDALEQGDRIHAVIRGSAINQDGASGGLTVPSGPSQEQVIQQALEAADVAADSVSYVEAHGTGTALGDPIEIGALGAVFGSDRPPDHPLLVGSVKTAIGHLEAAAGVAGLIKVALALEKGSIPPHLHLHQPNPLVDWDALPLAVPVKPTPWPAAERPRAGISSFGFSGTNAHIVMEAAPATPDTGAPASSGGDAQPLPRPQGHLLALSARTPEALEALIGRYAQHLRRHPELAIEDVAFTAATGRSHFRHRLALAAESTADAGDRLAAMAGGATPRGARRGRTQESTRIAFLFSGQGSQYLGMGRELYETEPAFRDALDRCAGLLAPNLERPLLEVIHARDGDGSPIDETAFTQPALFALEYALVMLWRSWGIEPHAVIGHSVGEYVAACIAGCMSLEDGLALIAARGRLMQAQQRPGRMAVAFTDEATVAAAIAANRGEVSIAALNGPDNCVISGAAEQVSLIVADLEARGIGTHPLRVSHAFHSPLMDPILAEFGAIAARMTFAPPRLTCASNVTGEIERDVFATPDYWVQHVSAPVRFASGMDALRQAGCNVFLEIGPKPSLLAMARTCLPDAQALWLPSLRPQADREQMLDSLGSLYVQGAPIDWNGVYPAGRSRRVALPTYPFQRQRHWIERRQRRSATDAAHPSPDPVATRDDAAQRSRGAAVYDITWRPRPLPGAEVTSAGDGRWLVLGDSGFVAAVAEALDGSAARCAVACPGRGFARTGNDRYQFDPTSAADYTALLQAVSADGDKLCGIVQLLAPDASRTGETGGEPGDADAAVERVLLLSRALTGSGLPGPPRLWLVTRGAIAADPGAASDPRTIDQASVWGFGRTLALEHPELWGGMVDLAPDGSAVADARVLASELLSGDEDDQVAYPGGARHVPRLTRRADATPASAPVFSPTGTYLVTGGLGALGLQAAHWLASRGARQLMLVSRRGEKTPGTTKALARLRDGGCEVTIASADVSRQEDVRGLLETVASGAAPLRGVVHAAGVEARRSIADMTVDELRSMIAAKARGGWLLHRACRGADVDLFLCFSSVSAVWGSTERAHYAAANAALDAIAQARRAAGLPALSINWGPWKGGGMATHAELEQLARLGNRGLEPAEALDTLDTLVTGGCAQGAVVDVDWPRFRSVYEARRPRPLLAEIAADRSDQPGPSAEALAGDWARRLNELPADGRAGPLRELLRREIARTLGAGDPQEVALDQSVFDLGMDSLMAVEATSRINRLIGLDISNALFEHPRIDALAARLLEQLPATAPTAESGEQVRSECPGEPAADALATGTTDEPAADGGSLPEPGEIRAFSRLAWPRRDDEWIEARWRWRYIDSAERLGTDPRVWVHREAGGIVAHHGAMPVRLRIADEELDTAWFVDTMVLESHRASATGARLIMEARRDLPFALSLGQTGTMREMAYRLGWQRVGPLRSFVFPLRAYPILRQRYHPAVAAFAGVGLDLRQHVKRVAARAPLDGLESATVDRFGASHDRLWESIRGEYECAVVRDASYLNWKYVEQPGRHFVRLEFTREARVVAVAVLAVYDPSDTFRYRRAFVVEFVVSPSDSALVLGVLEIVRRRCLAYGADSIVFDLINAKLERLLEGYGYLEREPSRYLLASDDQLTDDQRHTVLSPTKWLITRGDSDLDCVEMYDGCTEVILPP